MTHAIAHTFPKDNPGPDNATLLRLDVNRVAYTALKMRGDNAAADAEVALALKHLDAAIRHYEAMK